MEFMVSCKNVDMVLLCFGYGYFGPKLRLLLVRSLFILLCCSFLLGPSGTVQHSLLAVFVAALLLECKWEKTELLRCWPEWHSVVTH